MAAPVTTPELERCDSCGTALASVTIIDWHQFCPPCGDALLAGRPQPPVADDAPADFPRRLREAAAA